MYIDQGLYKQSDWRPPKPPALTSIYQLNSLLSLPQQHSQYTPLWEVLPPRSDGTGTCHPFQVAHSSWYRWQCPGLICDESHFYLYFSSFFPYIFNTITTKRWQVANKETLLRHSRALRPTRPPRSTQPSQLTQHYQDYDVNFDDRAADSCSHSICFPIQCGLLWPALLSLLSFH